MWKDVLRLQLDIGLALTELGCGLALARTLDRVCAQGSGAQPVISIPGFTAPERSLAYLTRFLNRNGYDAHSWGLGVNSGPTARGFTAHVDELASGLRHRVRTLADQNSRGVALVGHSLGGVYARELALRLQPDIDRVITLGAPIFPAESFARHNTILRLMGERQAGLPLEEVFVDAGTTHWPAQQPDIPCVAIVSPIDGAVSDRYALIPRATVECSRAPAVRENIRVMASHVGMAVNPLILLALADRLAADITDWRAFDPACYRDLLRLPARHRPGAGRRRHFAGIPRRTRDRA